MTNKVHYQARKAADLALAKRQISRPSYDAILAGEIGLERARQLGRSGTLKDATEGSGGPETATEIPGGGGTEDTDAPARRCLCGCGQVPRGEISRFVQGRDHRLFGELKRNLEKDPLLRNKRFTEEQRAYARQRELV